MAEDVKMQNRDSIPVVREGVPFILLTSFFSLIMSIVQLKILAITGLMATFFVTYFFRNPKRIVPTGINNIVAPADGRVVTVEEASPPSCFRTTGKFTKISIFMSIFDVHVNRSPCNGTIKDVKYFKGRFRPAQKDIASNTNEKNCILIETEHGETIVVVQVAGLIARRIVFWKKTGETVSRGERIGMIRFGSRVDLYVPSHWKICKSVGVKVKGGEDIICNRP